MYLPINSISKLTYWLQYCYCQKGFTSSYLLKIWIIYVIIVKTKTKIIIKYIIINIIIILKYFIF